MAAKRDLYEVLGISKTADEKTIKKAYRKLAKKYHPDMNPGDKTAEQKFKEATDAYNILSDPEKRKLYDQYGHAAFDGTGAESEFYKNYQNYGSLSGGQRQAMALLMTTMAPIEILILDEHTAALDPKTAELIMELTGKVVKEKKLTTIMVTHNLRYAVEYGNRILMMHQGHAVLDKAGEEKAKLVVDDLLDQFNQISIECGN